MHKLQTVMNSYERWVLPRCFCFMLSLLFITAWFPFSLQIFPILSDTPDTASLVFSSFYTNCCLNTTDFFSASNCLKSLSSFPPPPLPETSHSPSLNCRLKSLVILHSTAAYIPSSFHVPIAAWSLCSFFPQLLPDPFVLSFPNCCLIPMSFLTPTAAWSLCLLLSHLLSNDLVQLLPVPLVLIYPNCCLIPCSLTSPLPPNAPTPCSLTSPLLPYPLFSYITTAAQCPCLLSSQLLPIPPVLYPLILLYPNCCLKFPYPSISLLLLNPLILFILTATLSLSLINPNCFLFPCPHLSNCCLIP